VGISRNGFIDKYIENGLTIGKIEESRSYNQVFEIILNATKILSEYSDFSENLIYEYCDFQFNKFTKLWKQRNKEKSDDSLDQTSEN